MTTLRQFFDAAILLGDHGRPLEETPLLRAVVEGYEGDYHNRVIVSPRRNGKSSAVAHLASHILGAIARVLPVDWNRLYAHPVYYLETFVDPARFRGTCYRAANWIPSRPNDATVNS